MTRPPDAPTRTIDSEARPPLAAVIRVLGTPAAPSEYKLEGGTCRIGAAREADVVVADETVSRLHVELRLMPEGVRVVDLGSRNGIYYLGQRIEAVTLTLGSRFRMGQTEIALDVDRQSLDRIAPIDLTSYGRLIGVSPEMRRVFALLLRLESSLASVLVQGESGTGKELVARAIHDHSPVSSGPFIAVNCGALDRALARSELFGHRRGAFTGATDVHVGAFETASGGTLFLDEVGELPADVQPLLLRALETGAIARVGESQERPVKVRVVAATNRELSAEAAAGRFRQDLYYRLAVVTLTLPPLRNRPEDIEALARSLAAEMQLPALSPATLASFRDRSWPGNARELRNALESYAALGIDSEAPALSDRLTAELARWMDLSVPYTEQREALVEAFQRVYFPALIERSGGDEAAAARVAGIDRGTLRIVLSNLEASPSGRSRIGVLPEGSLLERSAEIVDALSLSREDIVNCLVECDWVQEKAWRALKLSSRHVLARLIRRYDIEEPP